MLRVCSWDGINASRNVSKSCFVSAGAGLASGVGADDDFAGGGEGREIKGEGAGPCARAATATKSATPPIVSFRIRGSLPVGHGVTRLRYNPEVARCETR